MLDVLEWLDVVLASELVELELGAGASGGWPVGLCCCVISRCGRVGGGGGGCGGGGCSCRGGAASEGRLGAKSRCGS